MGDSGNCRYDAGHLVGNHFESIQIGGGCWGKKTKKGVSGLKRQRPAYNWHRELLTALRELTVGASGAGWPANGLVSAILGRAAALWAWLSTGGITKVQ